VGRSLWRAACQQESPAPSQTNQAESGDSSSAGDVAWLLQSGRPANEEDMETMAKKAKKAKKTKKAKAKKKK
jgi:hypothetical protein